MRRLLVAAAVVACVAVLAAIALVVAGVVRGGQLAIPVPPTLKPEECTIRVGPNTAELTLEQGQHAATIAAVGFLRGDGVRGVTVALATALQESKLENTPGGDRDSVGLFQQRPSQGWGSPSQLADPRYAATAFYRKLETVDNWRTRPVAQAAQAVQRSADGSAYAGWEPEATTLATAYSGQSAGAVSCLVRSSHSTAAMGEDLRRDVRTDLGGAASASLGAAHAGGVPSLRITANPASADLRTYRRIEFWLVAHAQRFRIASVSYRDVKWTATEGSWKTLSAVDTSGHIVVEFS